MCDEKRLTTETVQSAALSLKSVDDIERSDSLALGVFSVGDCVADNAFEEGLEDTAGFLVDHWDDALITMLWFKVKRKRHTS